VNAVLTQHIVMTPGVCSGRPRIDGTRIRVMDIVGYHYKGGLTIDDLQRNFPQISLADIHAALAFYHDNKELIDHAFEEDDRFVAEQMARLPHQ